MRPDIRQKLELEKFTCLIYVLSFKQIFTANSPRNNRPDVDDVVIIITDGEPRGKWNSKEVALRYAGLLKDKGVLIVGAAVGPNRKKFKHILEQLATSKRYTLDADFQNMDAILGKLVESSCIKPGINP